MVQFYVLELQQYQDESYGHIVHFASDEDYDTARMKAESKYHEVLSAAAISNLLQHSAALIASDGNELMSQCYKHPKEEASS